jgi:hypothetical protein
LFRRCAPRNDTLFLRHCERREAIPAKPTLASGDAVKTKRARPVALTPQALWLELMPFYIREAWLLDERKAQGVARSL